MVSGLVIIIYLCSRGPHPRSLSLGGRLRRLSAGASLRPQALCHARGAPTFSQCGGATPPPLLLRDFALRNGSGLSLALARRPASPASRWRLAQAAGALYAPGLAQAVPRISWVS